MDARSRAQDFLQKRDEFSLGSLITESSHEKTKDLSSVAASDTVSALKMLFSVDEDVLRFFEKWAETGEDARVAGDILETVDKGGRIFFSGCGSTGRLSILLAAMWSRFFQSRGMVDMAKRAVPVMAGGDYALIKSVEGFEDYEVFGKRQLEDAGFSLDDILLAITEGGETSFVIGTAKHAVDCGAKTYLVYNNPDDVLVPLVTRSREVIEDNRIHKINLTTGPMAITGSTRMQATTIELCVMTAILETVCRKLTGSAIEDSVALEMCGRLSNVIERFKREDFLSALARVVEMESEIYSNGGKTNYYADSFALDVLTDTTERSPTFCTPPFRKTGDTFADEGWAHLITPQASSDDAWQNMLGREITAVEWTLDDLRSMLDDRTAERQHEIVRKISRREILRFKIGLDGTSERQLSKIDMAVGVVGDDCATDFFSSSLENATRTGAKTAMIYVGCDKECIPATPVFSSAQGTFPLVHVQADDEGFLLAPISHIALKMAANAMSTCVMVRLGRVMGNYMVYVVPSNLKLIDRATRYISDLAGVDYETACHKLFEVIIYIEDRMKNDKSYPPVVKMAVLRIRENLSNEEAEQAILTSSHG